MPIRVFVNWRWIAARTMAVILMAGVLGSVSGAAEDLHPAVSPAATNVDTAYGDIKLFTEVLIHIKRQYVNEKSYQEIVTQGMRGLLQSLDPHSDFLDEDAYRAMKEDTSSRFCGIGINIGVRDGTIAVIAPIEDTPAFRAGLLAGDLIVEIDGKKTQGMTLQDAVKRLRGAKGEKVLLGVRRQGEDELLTFDIARDDIEVPSVKGVRILRNGTGYIRLTQFAGPTADSLQKALNTLAAQGMDALVLDLRNNHGGLLKSAIDVAQKFLRKDDLIVTTRGRAGVHDEIRNRAMGDVHLVDFPMAVLVDGGSASASEILAGALQDHKRAILIGERTYGKASVQSLIPLKSSSNAAIRLTIAHYYTPKDREIHEKGIKPDIEIPLSPKEWMNIRIRRAHIENPELFTEADRNKHESVSDPHLDRAMDVLDGVKILLKK